ncbi:MAG: hypothetical protein KF724_11830 [Phycisphaeraceae bacterium]|nr:hypothetical protein [Phycisphaeraceae bacterium]
MRRLLPLWIAAIAGFTVIASNFIPRVLGFGDLVTEMFNVLAAVAFVLGAASIAKVHLTKVSAKRPGWGYSVVTLLCFAATLAVGFLKVGVAPAPLTPDLPFSGSYSEPGGAIWWIYEYLIAPITAALFSLLAFFVASAAFRAFRAKNLEAGLLLGTAFIILLGRTAASAYLTGWFPPAIEGLKLENLSLYIMQVFNTAGNRAIMIGIALGVAATSLRILLGIDRSYLGAGE